MMNSTLRRSAASFRDPDGYVFQHEGEWYRYVAHTYQETYDHLIESGLYERLVNENLLVPHQEVVTDLISTTRQQPYKILKPSQIDVITYPYEWSFSQLKEAAMVTLKIQKIAQAYEMSLKDASSFNIQVFKGHPVLMDTLSFTKQPSTQPWLAMGQFYRHFLWPLLAMCHADVNFNKQFLLNLDGFKIDTLQPWFGLKSWFKLSTLVHVHLHYWVAKLSSKGTVKDRPKQMTLNANGLRMILDRMQRLIEKLDINHNSIWKEYYQNTNYHDKAFLDKEAEVKSFIQDHKGCELIDFGANNGHFSRLAEKECRRIYALDFDPMAIDHLYRNLSSDSKHKIIPIIVDLSNPTPGIGWHNQERQGILSRLPNNSAGLVLALTHHLHISYNINFMLQAKFFSQYCDSLLIEFVHPDDSQVIKLLNNRYDDPTDYSQVDFEAAFTTYFDIKRAHPVQDARRHLYYLKRK
jgi:lambda repressor-like predicted transcriptional regulator